MYVTFVVVKAYRVKVGQLR